MRKRVRRGARIHLVVCVEAVLVLEHCTVLDDAGLCSTRRHRAREYATVPAVHKVTVQSVTSRVTVREDEAATVVYDVELLYAKQNLKEDRDEMAWVRGRTATIVNAVRVGHVGLVIGRVEVYTIPARGKKDLSPEAIWAVGVGESWSLRHRRTIEVNAIHSFRSIVIEKAR